MGTDNEPDREYRLEYKVAVAFWHNGSVTLEDREQIIMATSDEEARFKSKVFLYDESVRSRHLVESKKLSKIEKEAQDEKSFSIPFQ